MVSMNKQLPFIASLVGGFLAGPVHGQMFFVLEEPVVLDLSAQELIGSPGNVQNVNLGFESLLVSGNVVTTSLSDDPVPINDSVAKFFSNPIFRVQFGNGDVPCDGSLSVTGAVEDDHGNAGRVTSMGNLASYVLLSFMPVEVERQCRGNGSLLRLRYGGNFKISGIANSSSSGAYSGTLTINISNP